MEEQERQILYELCDDNETEAKLVEELIKLEKDYAQKQTRAGILNQLKEKIEEYIRDYK